MRFNIRHLSVIVTTGVNVILGAVAAVHAAPATGALFLEHACSLATPAAATPLPDDRSAGTFASGWAEAFAPDLTARAAHARFDADMLAAPARVRLADDAQAAWLGASGTVPAFEASEAWAAGVPHFADAAWATSAASRVGPQPAVAPQSGARAWGNNGYGQLGNGTTTNSNSPVTVSSANGFTGTGVTALAAGGSHSLALQGGVVYAWGIGGDGALGNGTRNDSNVPVAVISNGTFTNTNVTAIAAGNAHSLAILGGAVYAWGFNGTGALGNGTTTGSTVPVAVGGANANVTAIAAGGLHSLAIQGGAVIAWGDNSSGQLGNSTTTQSNVPGAVSNANGFTNSGVTAIAAGDSHSLAIRNGALYAWGSNAKGQLGNNTTTNSSVPVAVLNLSTGVTAVAAGSAFCLAVQNGNVFSWGDNSKAQLGNGTSTQSNTPVEVSFGGSFLSGIVQVAAGSYSSYALASDGSLYVWGYNGNGELGLGSSTLAYSTPQHFLPPSGQYYQFIDSDGDGIHALAYLGSTPPVPEPATWTGGALLLALSGISMRRRVRTV